MDFITCFKDIELYSDQISINNLLKSIDHLYKAMELLTFVNNEIVDDSIDALNLIQKLNESWLEVNKCRLYTESIQHIEEVLIPSMGLINDAKCMLESLVAWKLGLTLYGKSNILKCIKQAASEMINPTLSELEDWFDYLNKNNHNNFIRSISF